MNVSATNRSAGILKKMTLINCGVSLKSKKESLQAMKERFEQLKTDKKTQNPEFKMLKKILEA